MGTTQSTSSSSSSAPPPAAVPYTTYSVDAAQQQQQQQQKSQKSQGGVDGIVTVLSGGEGPAAGGGGGAAGEDAELAALRALPVFAPIIRGSLAGNILGRVKSEQARGVDAAAALMLCGGLQEHLKLCGATAAEAQDGLALRIRDAERLAEHVAAQLLAHAAEVRALTERLGDVDGLVHAAEAVRQRVAFADAALHRLDVALRAAEAEIETVGAPSMARVATATV